MDHVASIALGYKPDQSLANAIKIAARGFPQGAVVRCTGCSRSDVLNLEETAVAMMEGWPRCHGARMMIEIPGEPAAVAVRSRPTYRIVLEAELQAVPEIVRLRQLLKLGLRSFGFRCVDVQELPEPPAASKATIDA